MSETISTPERRDVTLVCGPTGLTPVKGKEGPGGPTGRPKRGVLIQRGFGTKGRLC